MARGLPGLKRFANPDHAARNHLMQQAHQEDQRRSAEPEPVAPVIQSRQRAAATPAQAQDRTAQLSSTQGTIPAQRRQFRRERREAERKAAMQSRLGNPGAGLKMSALRAQEDYMKSLAKSGIMDEKLSAPQQREQMSELHKAYTAMMAMQLVTPMQQGINGESMARTIGMGATMFMMSPNFRDQSREWLGEGASGVSNFIGRSTGRGSSDAAVEARGEKAKSKLDALKDKYGTSDAELLSGFKGRAARKWQKRLDSYEYMERGHREKFTEHSAAMTEVGLAENAYWAMREPGADVEDVKKQYEQARGVLYDFAEADGLDMGEVSQNMRQIVGQRLESDPKMASVFGQTGQGQFVKGEPKEMILAGTGEKVKVWSGDFHDVGSGRAIVAGAFDAREPQSEQEHMSHMARTMWGEMAEAKTVAEFNDVIDGYMVGAATQKDPQAVNLIEDESKRGRLGRASTMFESMSADGIEEVRQHEIYKATVIGAVEEAGRRSPELAGAWNEKFGASWAVRMAEQMNDFSDLGEQAASRPSREDMAEQVGEEVAEDQDDYVASVLDTEQVPRVDAVDEHEHFSYVAGASMYEYARVQLDEAREQGGVAGFSERLEDLQLASVVQDGSRRSAAVQSWFADVSAQAGLEGEDAAMGAQTYSEAITEAMQQVAAEHPEVSAHMAEMHGSSWEVSQKAQTMYPEAFVSPEIGPEASDEDRDRILVNAMSTSMSHDAAVSEAEMGSSSKKRTGAVMMSLHEYTSGEPTGDVLDQEYSLREARAAEMDRAMKQAGIDDPTQRRELYATAVARTVEQVSERSAAGRNAVSNYFGEGNVKQKAFQRASGLEAAEAASELYDQRKERLGLPGSSTAHARAEEKLAGAAASSSTDSRYAQEVSLTRAVRQSSRRDNKHHNGIEVTSGRWYEDEKKVESPEMGG